METTQRNSMCSYLYLKLAKTPCFSNYISCFFFYKVGEQDGGTGSAWRRGVDNGVRGEVVMKGVGG
jgi:hypothetical protein